MAKADELQEYELFVNGNRYTLLLDAEEAKRRGATLLTKKAEPANKARTATDKSR